VMARDGGQPGVDLRLIRAIRPRPLPNADKNVLRDFLGHGAVAHNRQCQAEHETAVSVVQFTECVGLGLGDQPDQGDVILYCVIHGR